MSARLQLRNLTPHVLTLHPPEGTGSADTIVVLAPYVVAPRLVATREHLGELCGLSVVRTTLGAPKGLPDPEDGIILIVSALVAEHPSVADRTDLAYPGEAVRDQGRVVGARGLCAGPGLARRMRREVAP